MINLPIDKHSFCVAGSLDGNRYEFYPRVPLQYPPASNNGTAPFYFFFFFYVGADTLANHLIQTRLKAVRKTNSPARTRGVMASCVSLALLRLLAALRP